MESYLIAEEKKNFEKSFLFVRFIYAMHAYNNVALFQNKKKIEIYRVILTF